MGESKKAFSADKDVVCRTHIGGQALIEGIMMRGRYNWAVAVRQPDGTIYTEEHDLASGRKKNAWMYWPIVRGCTAFIESLGLGYKALGIAADHAFDLEEEEEDEQPAKSPAQDGLTEVSPYEVVDNSAGGIVGAHFNEPTPATTKNPAGEIAGATPGSPAPAAPELSAEKDKESGAMGGLMTVSMIIGLALGVLIFVVAPAALSNLVMGEQAMNTMGWNVFDGIVRVVIFIAYIWLISRMKDIKRMFSYHGAEHKTIHCYEHGDELTPENAMKYPRLHVRCGTAFMIMVMIIAIFIYTVLGQPINSLIDLTGITEGPLRFVLIVLTRVILMPLIAGFSYEITVKWAGQRPDNLLVRIILWPGMQMQRLTTNPPDESMLECAIEATKLILAREEAEAAKAAEGAEPTEAAIAA